MNIETDDTNFADIENIESIEGIIKIGNSGAPSISDLSPNSDWKCFPQSSYNSCYGLPYQDHNYGAPPPPTPPPSPGNTNVVTKKKSFEVALKSLKPNKAVPEKKGKTAPKKQIASRRKSGGNPKSSIAVTVVKPPASSEQQALKDETEPEGEGGEGAPATGDYSDSITRCICSYTHDDGYMICCDQCQVWQHIDCMGIDRNEIPEEYSCEQCMPRKVHKARARLIQKNKRDELLRSSSEDENANSKKSPNQLKANTRNSKSKFGTQRNKKITQSPVKNGAVISDDKTPSVNPTFRAKRQSKRINDLTVLSVDGDAEELPWSSPYETATVNQYSTDIQESLKIYRPNGTYQLESVLSELDSPRCQLRLLVSGKRGLEVDSPIRCDQALIEFKGKVLLRQQFEQENNFIKRPQPYVLFYNKWDGLKICVDATSFGNEARFVRRSCIPNSEVRHVIENGQVHLVIFSVTKIETGGEVTIPFDFEFKSCEYCVECACVRAQCPVRKAGRKYQKCLAQGSGDHSKARVSQPKETGATSTTPAVVKREHVHEELKVQIPPNNCATGQQLNSKSQNTGKLVEDNVKSPNTERAAAEETRRLSREDRKIEAYMKAFEKLEKMEERRKEALQRLNEKKENPEVPAAVDKPAAGPENLKLRSPPQATQPKSTPKPAAATRSVSTVKPAVRRRRNRSGPATRRRTTSTCTAATVSQPASDVEQEDSSNNCVAETSQDGMPTSRIPAPDDVGSTYTGTVSVTGPTSSLGFRFPKTKKQILHEWYQGKGQEKCLPDKPLTVSVSQAEDNIDFVKTNSSPGSSWAHMRRNSMSSNVQPTHTHATHHTPIITSRKLDTSMGSAKKRWLKQAMEEDCSNQSVPTLLASPCNEHSSPPNATNSHTTHSETPLSPNGSSLASTSNHAADFVTPLKKRRLARESLSLDSRPTSPTTSATPTTPPPDEKSISSDWQTIPMSDDDAQLPSPAKQEDSKLLHIEPVTMMNNASQSNVYQIHTRLNESDNEDNIIVPEPVRACSPVLSPSVVTDDIPTTIMDVVNDDCLVSPLRKYRLRAQQQRKINATTVTQAAVSTTAAILSPREPRTLGAVTQAAVSTTAAILSPREPRTLGAVTQAAVSTTAAILSPREPRTLGAVTQAAVLTTAAILSPREPRTLGDIMHQTATDEMQDADDVAPQNTSYNISELNAAVNVALLRSPEHLQRPALQCDVTNEYYNASPPKISADAFSASVCVEPSGAIVKLNLDDTSPTKSSVSPNQQVELKRSVSLFENTTRYDDLNGDGGVSPVQKSIKQELCGEKEYALITPPQKKKVSLLEYRKRMQIHPPKSDSYTSVSAPTTPLLAGESVASITAGKQMQHVTLPSLPLFNDLKESCNVGAETNETSTMKRPLISLDERLKLEFGFVPKAEDREDESDDSCDTPPPPPPPLSLSRSATIATPLLDVPPLSNPMPQHDDPVDNAPIFNNSEATTVENGYSAAPQYSDLDSLAKPVQSPDYNRTFSESPGLLNTEQSQSPMPTVRKAQFPLKQGSLGAVMLGQPPVVSPICNVNSGRDISGARQTTPLNLPKKYR